MISCSLKHFLPGVLSLLFLGCLLCFPLQSIQGVKAGLTCCTNQLIPALFPFLIVSDLLLSSPVSSWLGLIFLPYTRYFLKIKSKRAAGALFLCFLGGFAVCAKLLSRLYQEGIISRREAEILLVCAAGSGPGFVINSVGFLMLGNQTVGVCLFVSLFCSGLCCGILASLFIKKSSLPSSLFARIPDDGPLDFTGSVSAAVHAMLTISGFVLLFSCLIHCSAQALNSFPAAYAVLSLLLEVTCGCRVWSSAGGCAAIYGCCAALSLLSLSVFCQLRALLPADISLKPLLLFRPVHLLFSVCFLRVFLHFLPGAQQAVSTLHDRLILQSRIAPDAALVLFLLCCFVLRFTSAGGWDIMIRKKNPPFCTKE